MSEHWKSTPKYWCKHCACYVRDTKLERQNHEATGKHQGAIKRFLRDLHRGHEREGRDKERAQREIARLNGVVSGTTEPAGTPAGSSTTGLAPQPKTRPPGEAELKKQREQLAELGVAIPSSFRPEMAMPGEWTVTNTRVIEKHYGESGDVKIEAKASGVRKREETEEQQEEEEAIRTLFKKPKRWGRDSKLMPQEEDVELDALLNGSTVGLRPSGANASTTIQPESLDIKEQSDVGKQEEPHIKQEEDENHETSDGPLLESGVIKQECLGFSSENAVKTEADDEDKGSDPPPVIFKKRKPKGLRSK